MFQTLDSDKLVPLSADLSDLIRTLSDLSIQAYQQLISITETRLQNIIGTTKVMTSTHAHPSSALLIYLLIPLSLSPCPVGERDHPRSIWLSSKAGSNQEASGLGPQDCRGRSSHDGVCAEGAWRPSHCPDSASATQGTAGASLSPAHLPHLCLFI